MSLTDRLDYLIHPANGLHEIDQFIEHFIAPRKDGVRVFVPRTDIVEHTASYSVYMDLPGIDSADITVEATEDRLIIVGEKKPLESAEDSTMRRRERFVGRFEREFSFPTPVDFEKISASSNNGVLHIEVPKADKVVPRKIEVSVG